jgi:hypothetical protein
MTLTTEDHHSEVEGGAETEDGAAGRAVRANYRRHASKAIGQYRGTARILGFPVLYLRPTVFVRINKSVSITAHVKY